jgi:hypothetical protein
MFDEVVDVGKAIIAAIVFAVIIVSLLHAL